jgi:ribosomal protein L40E
MQNPTLCPHCGAQISENAQFCRSCGKPITTEPTSAPRPAILSAERKCSHCGAVVSADAKFCRACGKTIEFSEQPPSQILTPASAAAPPSQATCPQCGAALSPTAQFCRACGKPVKPSAAQAPAVAPRAMPLIRQPLPGRVPVTPPPTPKKRRIGCGFWTVSGCVAIIMLCLIGAVGVYFAFRSGTITQKTLLNLVGVGPGKITLMNFRDDAIQATLTPLKESKNEAQVVGKNLSLSAYEINNREIDQGRYRIEFRQQGASALLAASCTLTIHAGDSYRFVALPEGIMVDRANAPSNKAADLIPETSAFCR